jgi:hypothetical protein
MFQFGTAAAYKFSDTEFMSPTILKWKKGKDEDNNNEEEVENGRKKKKQKVSYYLQGIYIFL